MNNMELSISLLKKKIILQWHKTSSIIQIDSSFTKEEAVELITSSILNKILDMEVNSKTYTKDEFTLIKKNYSDFIVNELIAEKDKDISKEAIESLKTEKEKFDNDPNNKGKDFYLAKLIDPEDFGFPPGLSRTEYEILVLSDINKFIEQMTKMNINVFSNSQGSGGQEQGQSGSGKQNSNQSGQGQGNGQGQGSSSQGQSNQGQSGGSSGSSGSGKQTGTAGDQNGTGTGGSNGNQQSSGGGSNGNQKSNGGSQGSSNGSSGGSNGNGQDQSGGYSVSKGSKITKKDLQNSNLGNDDCIKDDKDSDERLVDPSGNIIDVNTNTFTDQDADSLSTGGNGRGSGHESNRGNTKIDKETKGIKELTNFILARSRKTRYTQSRDHLHNYNRKKFSGSDNQTIIPVVKRKINVSTTNNVFLCDVSGSMNGPLLLKICKSVIDLKDELLSKNQRIIQWDTGLVKDESIDKFSGMSHGGGTDLAQGIEYTKKYLNKNSDILFVLSDLEDDLQEWERKAKELPCTVYAINVNAGGEENYSYFKKIIPYNLLKNV
jgi:hypothetical protein